MKQYNYSTVTPAFTKKVAYGFLLRISRIQKPAISATVHRLIASLLKQHFLQVMVRITEIFRKFWQKNECSSYIIVSYEITTSSWDIRKTNQEFMATFQACGPKSRISRYALILKIGEYLQLLHVQVRAVSVHHIHQPTHVLMPKLGFLCISLGSQKEAGYTL